MYSNFHVLLRLWIKCAVFFRSQFSFINKWTFAALNQVRGVFETSIKTMNQLAQLLHMPLSDFQTFDFYIACPSCVDRRTPKLPCAIKVHFAVFDCLEPIRHNVINNRSLWQENFRTVIKIHWCAILFRYNSNCGPTREQETCKISGFSLMSCKRHHNWHYIYN